MILLASKSPRRRELLAALNIPFRIVNVCAEEGYPADLKEGDIPLFIARQKADAYREPLTEGEVLLTADTIVWLDGTVLGKPKDEEEAAEMLHRLSGKTHQVYTGVFLRTAKKECSFVSRSDVTFRELTEEEIHHYITNYHPLDKAGAYGIQEWIGYTGCVRIEGSFYNVMGLPTAALYDELKKLKQMESD